jgi:pimeloyl-ACP methyl ester carboxylesterase
MTLPPRARISAGSSTVTLRDGRNLGFDEIGDPEGTPILFFHGFGSSRLIRHPDDSIATELGARLICVDRPGIGLSTAQPGRRLSDWPADVAELADHLGLATFGVLGWSGGGPYALACAWWMPDRVTAASLVSAPAPLAGVRSADYLYRRHRAAVRAADTAPWVIRLAMWRWARAQKRDPERQLDAAVAKMVEADRVLIGDPRIRAQMLANADEMVRQGHRGLYDEALIMARPWGFRLRDVRVPTTLWHGDDDPSVPVAMGRYVARELSTCDARFFPGEGHHLLFDRWQEILADVVARAGGPRSGHRVATHPQPSPAG